MIKKYIDIAFDGDWEIKNYFDPSYPIAHPREASDLVYQKLLSNYPDATFEKVEFDGKEIGFFVWSPGLLISFGVNISYRKKEPLTYLWMKIREVLGKEFSVALFSRNTRAIDWLRKCGMGVFAEDITILVHTKK